MTGIEAEPLLHGVGHGFADTVIGAEVFVENDALVVDEKHARMEDAEVGVIGLDLVVEQAPRANHPAVRIRQQGKLDAISFGQTSEDLRRIGTNRQHYDALFGQAGLWVCSSTSCVRQNPHQEADR